jgi:hypothetical protein
MQTHQIHVSGAREHVDEIRGELFAFPEVLDVVVTGRPNVLVVVYSGRPRPAEWLRALRAIGYRTPARDHARWPRRDQPSMLLLRSVVQWGKLGADDGDSTTRSNGNKRASSRRRDAA